MGKLSSLIRAAGGKKRFSSAVILSAGSGTRFSEDRVKQFVEIDSLPVLVRSCMAFEKSELTDEIIVVTREADVEGCRNILSSYGIKKLTSVVSGGATRQQSAKNGFLKVNERADFVAVHDAARCLVTPEMIDSTFETAFVYGAAASASRVVDTIKRTNSADTVTETVDRENTWLIATPQIFMTDMYRAMIYTAEKDGVVGTDDSYLAERLGFKVQLVDCGKTNIKITYPEDEIIAEAILKSRRESGGTK